MVRERQLRWLRRLKRRILANRGNRCLACHGTGNLQLAHRRATGLKGMGRGLDRRLRDVKNHPRAYALLCLGDHRLYDTGRLLPPWRGVGWRCPVGHVVSRFAERAETGVIGGEVDGEGFGSTIGLSTPSEVASAVDAVIVRRGPEPIPERY